MTGYVGMGDLREPLAAYLSNDEREAGQLLCSKLNVNLQTHPDFWDAVVARIVGGRRTGRKCPHDVEVEVRGRRLALEVKGSSEFVSTFTMHGRKYRRHVFKWIFRRGPAAKLSADLFILLGLDRLGLLHAWVIPPAIMRRSARTVTMAVPGACGPSSRGPWAPWAVPPGQILDAVGANARRTINERSGQGDLLGGR